MASLKLRFFEERRNGTTPVDAVSTGSRILPLENARCDLALFLKSQLGRNARILMANDTIELVARKPHKKNGTTSLWRKAIVSMNDGAAYELRVLADILSETMRAAD